MANFGKNTRQTIIAALLCGALAPAASAADLREHLSVIDPVIKLGDLFDGLGAEAETIILEAPAPGDSKQLSSHELDRIAEQYSLDWQRPTYLKRVNVYREGNAFSLDDLGDIALREAQAAGIAGNIDIQVFGRRAGLYLPADTSVEDIQLENFQLNNRQDRFTAVALIPTGTNQPSRLNISGRVQEVRMVPTLARVLAPGEVISKSDIQWTRLPVRQINNRVVASSAELVGQTVKRSLQPGRPLYTTDVMAPVVVEKGSVVTMVVQLGGLSLTASGRALENGGQGDTIRVMNTKSKQTVDAKVLNPAQVAVTSNSLTLAAL
ncbi:flagellar basal body P-ring formation chaperone FlgA [Kordiimonas sp.]|uniref:flagellar basal body P-ring formation chaperone FlgA n=1 Tax=Kordiimonas sp. TaxID=1970157 RepID=UPI003A9466D8